MKTGFLLLLLGASAICRAQLNDDFSDGDFSANPSWTGTTNDFIVNASHQLQVSNTVAATSCLATPHAFTALDAQEWRLWVKHSFSPSSSNYSRVYLTAGSADLCSNPDGFFLQLGEAGALDAIRLNKIVGGNITEICSGPAAQIANSFTLGIRVVRSAAGEWALYTDATGGTNYTLQASGTDGTELPGTHTGVMATYTVSNATKFYFDNWYAGPEIVDAQPPALLGTTVVSAAAIDLLFDEPVSGTAVLNTGNYSFSPVLSVQSAAISGDDPALVHLLLSAAMTNGQSYTVSVGEVEDMSGNSATNLSGTVTYLVSDSAVKGDILLSEFFCDPSPSVGLEEVEFVEIYNASTKYFNLAGWKLGDASADGTITAGWIMPGEYKILCATSSQSVYPAALAVTSFPSLNNAGDDILLKTPALQLIDGIHYTEAWYNDPVKADGGYTIELINPNDPCSDASNWTASNALSGGTPGAQNSVHDLTPDSEAPKLLYTLVTAPDLLQVTFSEGMDSASVVNAVFGSNPALSVTAVSVPETFSAVASVQFAQPLAASTLYQFTFGPVADCWTNAATLAGTFALAEAPVKGDVVINELLFDPLTGGADFIELYNRSQKILDLDSYSVANYDDDTISNSTTVSGHFLLFPGDYFVLTPDSSYQQQTFPAAVSGRFYQMALPAMNNDSGTVFLGYNGLLIDRVSYHDDWHLSLIDNKENKTLERIDPDGFSNYKGNWHTAAETIGFGTPGGQNSQFHPGGVYGSFGALQPLFSPDNDGTDDVLQFYYAMQESGMIATLRIFDDQGRLVRELLNNELLATEGMLTWDGTNDAERKAGIGIYLAVIEAFSVDGAVNFSKRISFTLGGKLD